MSPTQPTPASPAATPAAPEGLAPLLRPRAVARVLGISTRTLERLLSGGRFPAPDLRIGRATLWRPASVRAWIDAEADRQRRRPVG